MLVVVLAAAAAAVACAGARLPLPVRLPGPGRAARIVMLAAWVLAVAALLACVAVYITQVGGAGLARTPPADPVTPVTLAGMGVVFFVIAVAQRAGGWRVAVGSAVAGAAAAPVIFELPFDLIIMPRTYPVVDPGLYRPLLFGTLIGVDVMTLALVSMSPAVRVRRATLWCLAGMLALFAVWGVFGFGYPSAPGPVTLNTLSKIVALAAAVTLFVPRRPGPGQAAPPGGGGRARPGRGSAPGGTRPRRRLLAGALCGALALAVAAAGCSPAARPAGTPAGRPGAGAGPAWLCRPGQQPDPCAYGLAATAVTAGGTLKPAAWPRSAAASKFSCFYLYPTWSLAKTGNTGLAAGPGPAYAAMEQAAPLSRVCDVWVPLYDSQTFPSVLKGLGGDQNVMNATFTAAYDSVLPAWQWFLAHTGGKPVILAGDSQGAAVLIHLISARLDHQPPVLRRLLSAVLVGGNLQVPAGKTAGATFTKVPLCTSGTQTGCAIAFSSYPSQPPAGSVFGRPGQGTSLQSGQTASAGQQVACVNPAALSGGTGDLSPYLLTLTQTAKLPGQAQLTEPVPTPWVTYPALYSASCKQGGGATWLQVTSLAGTSRARPVVNEDTVGNYGGGTGPAWGYHGYEYGLTLGNLLHDITSQETTWQSSH